MSRTVTALYDTRVEAELAALQLKAEASPALAEIYDQTPASIEALRQLDLRPEERAACENKLADGEYLLLAQPRRGESPDSIVAILERIAREPARGSSLESRPIADNAPSGGREVVEEVRLPLVEEELRVGTREVRRGGARVRTRVEDVPVQLEVELLEELARVERRPATRSVSPEELEQCELLRERVIEITQVREEPVLTKEYFVREEVVVSKTTGRRVEHIQETVRRTEVETEELLGEPAGSAPR